MNPDIFLLEKIDALAEIPDDLYLDFGYPKQMTVVYPCSGNEEGELDLSRGKLLPEGSESNIPNVYFFAPRT